MSEAQEVRAGLQAAATALAGMVLQQERIADMLVTWDERASLPGESTDGATHGVYVGAWELAAAELRAAIAPSSEDIRAALAKLEARAR